MVRCTDRPAMTIAVDLGRKATKQTNKTVTYWPGGPLQFFLTLIQVPIPIIKYLVLLSIDLAHHISFDTGGWGHSSLPIISLK